MKNRKILIRWNWLSSLFLFHLLKNEWFYVDIDLWENDFFAYTFIDDFLLDSIRHLFPNVDFKIDSFDWYFHFDNKTNHIKNSSYLWYSIYKSLLHNIEKNKLNNYDYDLVFDSKYFNNKSKYLEYTFSKINLFEIRIEDFSKNLLIEYYNNKNIPFYFYHIHDDLYIYWYYDISEQDSSYFKKILKEMSFWEPIVKNIRKLNCLNISCSLIKEYTWKILPIWNSLWALPPYTWTWNKVCLLDSLKILDSLKKNEKSSEFKRELFSYRLILFKLSSLVWYTIKSLWSMQKINCINKKLNDYINIEIKKYL